VAVSTALAVVSCNSDPTAPGLEPRIRFSTDELHLGASRQVSVHVENPSDMALGPVLILPGSVRNEAGHGVPGSVLTADPSEISTLNPGSMAEVSLSVSLPSAPQPGEYNAFVEARVPGGLAAGLVLRFNVAEAAPPVDGGEIRIAAGSGAVRQGDAVPFAAEVSDASGAIVPGVAVSWSVLPANAGFFSGTGQFVGYTPGEARIVATAGTLADTTAVTISTRGLSGRMSVVGRGGEYTRFSSDLWVHGNYAYQGTWGVKSATASGNTLHTWRITDPSQPVREDALLLDARTVNDVKVRADGALGIVTHEGSLDGLNGVSLLSLADPAAPQVVARLTTGLESGVHNAWLDGNYAYVVVDGKDAAAGLRVLDVSDPAGPRPVASFYGGSSFLHDVYVRNGLAFLSHWDAGLIILDVGHGIRGGSPTNPVEVSRIATSGGQTHNAWYWPEAGYVFVGEEDHASPGMTHVVDVRNLLQPEEVATFRVQGATPHNFWLDESRGILYLAWYARGIRALDVNGELMGELDRQGRELTGFVYDGSAGDCPGIQSTCSWAPQLSGGRLFVSDMNSGLLVLEPTF
jgi:hypothetical protein